MSRLADYLLVVGYDHQKQLNGRSNGTILQRFPLKDWSDTPFMEGVEWFCQPEGWALSSEKSKPHFFAFVLTDIDANRHYCACLSFNETVTIMPSKPVDEEEEQESLGDGKRSIIMAKSPSVTHHSLMYSPKCIVLVSRLDYVDVFRNCLGIIYTTYIENYGIPLETLVGNILGCVHVPPAGGPQVRFSIGAGDRQALQPPLSPTLPTTQTCVNLLFHLLGIRNVIVLFCAIMTENKILFHSSSYNRLTDCCRALTAIMYPFKYTHVYVPLLPSSITEILSSPTPFVIGMHSSNNSKISDLMDVILADLDGGAITVPDSVQVPLLPEPLWTNTLESLRLCLQPELVFADDAFAPLAIRAAQPAMLDKELRAVFMRLFAHLLQGYRMCLTIIRIHPKPVITFHKAAFLGERGLINCDFTARVLDCMFFNTFISERGPPWRTCDLWDELCSNIGDIIKVERENPNTIYTHIQELAQQLYINENPNAQPYPQKIPRPPDGAFERIHFPPLPKIDGHQVQLIIDEGLAQDRSRQATLRPINPRIVPIGPGITNILSDTENIITNSARRLEVLRNCVNYIFDNRISDARKSFPAVLRALKCKNARLALCAELAQHVSGNKAVLEHAQFDLICRLMNCALQDDSAAAPSDANGVATALLPLATAFCRKLCTGVIQFAYTCIQEHAVWQNQQFWEAAFYQDVQRDIKALYLPYTDLVIAKKTSPYSNLLTMQQIKEHRRCSSSISTRSFHDAQEPSALEVAAEQMRKWSAYDANKQNEFLQSEESTIYSQTIHYANRMVYLMIPLNAIQGKASNRHDIVSFDDERVSNSITNSVAESENSADAESGFDEQETTALIETNVTRAVSRFVDKVCTEGGVKADQVRSLHQMIPGVVHMHIETLESVQKEAARLPPIQKPKILSPNLLIGEEMAMEGLRVYLLPDGREESSNLGGPSLLPAEGAIFLTNYRIIFKGTPCDPYACEQIIVRAFPVASLTKEKRISAQQIHHLDQYLQQGGLQLRSCTFQLIKVGFDDEVTVDSIDLFRKMVHRLRTPSSLFQYYAFCGQTVNAQTPLLKGKEKNSTLKGFAKKTLMKTARKAGFKQKDKHQKYVLQNDTTNKYMTSPGRISLPIIDDFNPSVDDISLDDFDITNTQPPSLTSNTTNASNNAQPSTNQADVKTLERLIERSYVRDWSRLGLLNQTTTNSISATGGLGAGGMIRSHKQQSGKFRVTTLNTLYHMCRTYPALFVVPINVTDESIRRFSRCYRQGRIATVTWRHPRTNAYLMRGAALLNKGVIGMLKGHPGHHSSASSMPAPSSSGGTSNVETTSSLEHERYLNTIVSATHSRGHSGLTMSDSSLSINSLLLAAANEDHHFASQQAGASTPEMRRQSPFNKAVSSFGVTSRSSGGKSGNVAATFSKHIAAHWSGSLKDRRQPTSSTNQGNVPLSRGDYVPNRNSADVTQTDMTFQRAALYILGEKANMKATPMSQKIDFIPVEYYDLRHTKTAFKKLMRACIPSAVNAQEAEQSFYKSIETSEWLNLLQNIMQLSGAVVDLLDVQGSSVSLCLEDGWDITAQISSIAQLCLDPHYRTIDGFRTLIEKEWIGFGHRFNQRSNLFSNSQTSFAPVFLQFLDIIHQIQKQFPLAFEFNEYYLRFLAYHSVSCRFRTFLFDCEAERVESGIAAVEDKRGSLTSHHKGVVLDSLNQSDDESIYPSGGTGSGPVGSGRNTGGSSGLGQSVFDYIEKIHARMPIFYNFLYTPDLDNPVLRPQSQITCLDIWQYYIDEELLHGPSYDLEIIQMDCQQDEEAEAADGISRKSTRKIISTGYDNLYKSNPDAFTHLLDEVYKVETELGHLPQKWKIVWDKLELPTTDSLTRHASFSTELVRSHGRLLHKRSTLEILLRGKMVNSAAQNAETNASSAVVYSHPHRFERYNYTTFTHCDFCENVLWGPVKTGVRCVDCGYCCHDKCVENVAKNCTKYKANQNNSLTMTQTMTRDMNDTQSVNSSVNTLQTSSQQFYDQFSSNVAENSTHEGYLLKRGALLKGWKTRWFVLDSIKHQLRYYDAMEDSHCKGFIDLAEVINVAAVSAPSQNPPKKVDERSYFDLKTTRRTYNFCASDASMAQEWIEKINSCLQ